MALPGLKSDGGSAPGPMDLQPHFRHLSHSSYQMSVCVCVCVCVHLKKEHVGASVWLKGLRIQYCHYGGCVAAGLIPGLGILHAMGVTKKIN